MWVNREEHEALVKYKRDNMSEWSSYRNQIASLQDQLRIACKMYEEMKAQADLYKESSAEYKQKYADEVQKRLELVKLLENTPLTNE